MEALFLLIPLSLAILGLAVWIFLRMESRGQFRDVESHGRQLLLDDDRVAEENPLNTDPPPAPRATDPTAPRATDPTAPRATGAPAQQAGLPQPTHQPAELTKPYK